jgi:hypothetical protein
MARPGPWVAAFAAVAVSLVASSQALAVTSTTCATLQNDVNSATAGEVLQLPSVVCPINLSVANTNAFTLEGAAGGGTVLKPSVTSDPIVYGGPSAPVTFTLSGLSFAGTTAAAAILLESPGEAVTISGDTFTNNDYSSGFGAAVSIQTQSEPGTIATQPTVIRNDKFTGNQASSAGAVALLGSNPITLSGNTFMSNAGPFEGGAVAIFGTDHATTNPIQISGNTFGGSAPSDGNTSANSAGALALIPGQGQPVTISGNTFENNAVTGSAQYGREGGAVYILASTDLTGTISQSHNVFADNLIDATEGNPDLAAAGGAEFATGGGAVHSTADVFTGNRVASDDGQPPWGGAVAVAASGGSPAQPAVFVADDDLFENNSTAAGGWGGAIYTGAPPATCTSGCPADTVTLNDSTIVSNTVDAGTGSEGGAIWGSPADVLTLHNSIVFGNSPKSEIYGFATSPPAIADSDVCSEAGGPAVPSHVRNICANPLLASNGAETAASPTIDAGSNALVPAGLTTDLVGAPRIRASRVICLGLRPGLGPAIVDMGAYEFTGRTAAPPCVDLAGPRVVIGGGTLRLRKGKVSIKLSCPQNQSYCKGTVTLEAMTGKAKHKRELILGTARFDITGGHSKTGKIKLSGKAVRKLGSLKSVGVLVATVAHDAAHLTGRSSRKLKLKRS